MEKRVLLAIGISLLILVAYQYIFPPAPSSPPALTEQQTGQEDSEEPTDKLTPSSPAKTPAVASQAGGTLQTYLEDQQKKILQTISVKTDLYTINISNKGAVITSWLLHHYHNNKGDATPVQLVSKQAVKENFYPLSLVFDDDELNKRANNAFYEASTSSLVLNESNPEGKLELFYTDPYGVKISKELHFFNDNYNMEVVIRQQNQGDFPLPARYYLVWGYNLGEQKEASKYHYIGPTSFIEDELVDDKPKDIEGKVYHKGNISWTALQNTYFAAILIPHQTPSEVIINKDKNENLSIGVASSKNEIKPQSEVVNSFGLYAGPKEMDKLKILNLKLDKIIDYGWFDILAKPLMQVLNFSHRYTNNYGWDIIALTVLIKLLFYPISNASFKSMRQMQKVQPQMTKLRKKYKDDPKKLNEEIMALYKKHKVNPLGGCMPMLLQIPVFFALYKALLISIELRHAPFMLWIVDLSAKDPYYITPILMGLSQFVQQKMTPTGGDPKQAKLMLLMPIFFTVLFLNFPSGLVVYWLVNNVLGIGQQYMINKQEQATEAA